MLPQQRMFLILLRNVAIPPTLCVEAIPRARVGVAANGRSGKSSAFDAVKSGVGA
jgi:hypothetical protein